MLKTSKNTKDTAKIAQMFLKQILKDNSKVKNKRALTVGLSGDLGTGKTTFTQAAAKYLGIKRKVNSPTFVIIKKYLIKNPRFKFLFHLDAYRLKNEKELLHLGWEEIIANPEHLVFIEWPEHVAKIIPPKSHFVHISHTKKGYRNFKIKNA
jgi:tRNA threonylcarbamoyladenosine biosynthesis protein TsaE